LPAFFRSFVPFRCFGHSKSITHFDLFRTNHLKHCLKVPLFVVAYEQSIATATAWMLKDVLVSTLMRMEKTLNVKKNSLISCKEQHFSGLTSSDVFGTCWKQPFSTEGGAEKWCEWCEVEGQGRESRFVGQS